MASKGSMINWTRSSMPMNIFGGGGEKEHPHNRLFPGLPEDKAGVRVAGRWYPMDFVLFI